jgi:hypothetical protein
MERPSDEVSKLPKSKIAKETVDTGERLRSRLARRGDEEFLERMSQEAGVGQSAS